MGNSGKISGEGMPLWQPPSVLGGVPKEVMDMAMSAEHDAATEDIGHEDESAAEMALYRFPSVKIVEKAETTED